MLSVATEQVLRQYILSLSPGVDDCVIVLAGEKADFDPESLIQWANTNAIRIVGGLFPGKITGGQWSAEGVLIRSFKCRNGYLMVKDLKRQALQPLEVPEFQFDSDRSKPTALVLVDGLSEGISSFLSVLYSHLGNTVNYIGGGAGSISLQQGPCLFTNEGYCQDAAVVVFIDKSLSLKVKHGWHAIAGPYVATATKRNKINQLNWEPAIDVYKRMLKSEGVMGFGEKEFFNIAKSYPFGMYRDNGEFVIRDPLKLDSNEGIICVGEVPENTVLSIMKGDERSLLNAAENAVEGLDKEDAGVVDALLFDCISRSLFLGSNFEKELNIINEGVQFKASEMQVEGVLTLGEISSNGQAYLEFYNKTLILGLFHE